MKSPTLTRSFPASQTLERGTAHPNGGVIFLSHTSHLRSKEELEPSEYRRHYYRKIYIRQLLEQLHQQLTDAGFTVWYDRTDLKPGADIDTTIHTALRRCQAAVVLIDHDALDAGYMRREINVLMYRMTVDSLYVMPVLLGVEAEEVRNSNLGRDTGVESVLALRPATGKQNRDAASSTAQEVTQRLVAQLAKRRPDTRSPISCWIDDVATFLQGASPASLRRVAELLKIDLQAWTHSDSQRWDIAAALLSAEPEVVHAVLEDVTYQLDDNYRKRIVELALPLWVGLQAACTVREVANADAGSRRAIGLTTRAYRLGEHLAKRATAGARGTRVVFLADVHGEETIHDLLSRSDTKLRSELNISKDTPPEEIADAMRRRPDRGVYAVIRCDTVNPATTGAITRELQNRFPGIVFIVLAKVGTAAWQRAMIVQAYEDFTPELERAARKYVSDLNDLSGDRKIEVDSDE